MAADEGWYDDGQRPGKYRWWDGQVWTGFYSDVDAVIARGEEPGTGERPPAPVVVSAPSAAVPSIRPPVAEAPREPELPAPPPAPASPSQRAPFVPTWSASPLQYRLNGSAGWPNVEVAGESFHETEIVAALGRRPRVDEEIEVTVDATLVPEPNNRHDSNAISVRIKGKVVGYLPKDVAPLYKPHIDRITASGHVATTSARLWAVVRESWEGKAKNLYSNVRLAMAEPPILIPLNEPPDGNYSMIPWGSGLQVLGEEKHFDVLAPHVTAAGRGLLLVTLHRELGPGPKNPEFIEVRVDGRRAGQMSGAMSRHYFAVVDHLTGRGQSAAAWAYIKGSGLAAELVLQASKASEIPPEWLAGNAVTIPRLVPVASTYDLAAVSGDESLVGKTTARIKATLAERIARGLR